MPRPRPAAPRTSVAVVALVVVLLSMGCSSGEGGGGTTGTTTTTTPPDAPSPAGRPGPGAAVQLTPVATVDGAPVALAPRPGTRDLYVADQGGLVVRMTSPPDGSAQVDAEPALDLRDETRAAGEQGLLGLAFSPDGTHLYVDHTDQAGDTRVVEYAMAGDRADPDSRRELLFVDQPFPNHNGGQLAFGPDGFLYIGMGDGGGAGDPQGRAQDPDQLLGKVLRIDPRPGGAPPADGRPYAIPTDNPFAAGGGAPEVWLLGVRNPWRFSFDPATGDLWIADVGQQQLEEVDHLPATGGTGAGRGANLGWNLEEGTQPRGSGTPPAGLVQPVHEYPTGQDGTCAIIGGYVYRGAAIPALAGSYVFGDHCAADVRALPPGAALGSRSQDLRASAGRTSLSSFGQDMDGELLVLSTTGTVYRIEPG